MAEHFRVRAGRPLEGGGPGGFEPALFDAAPKGCAGFGHTMVGIHAEQAHLLAMQEAGKKQGEDARFASQLHNR